jgi:hypothetical protein
MSQPQWEYKRLYLKANTTASDYNEAAATFHYFGKVISDAPEWQDEVVAELGRDE